MRGYGGTRFVCNLVMSTLSAPSKRNDAVSDAELVDADRVERRCSAPSSNDTDNGWTAMSSRVTEREQPGASQMAISRSLKRSKDPTQRSGCHRHAVFFSRRFNNTKKKTRERRKKRLLFYPAFPEFPVLAVGLLFGDN